MSIERATSKRELFMLFVSVLPNPMTVTEVPRASLSSAGVIAGMIAVVGSAPR